MKTTKTIRNLLMAAAVLGLSVSVASCIDNIDNNGGKTPENQQEIVQSKADKYWSVVSQLVSTDDYTPDYEGKTFEPVYGVAQEGDPTTRLVYTNDVATAAERFADIVEVEGIDENTQTYTFDDPDIGTLTYTKGDEDGAILATVDVNIKQIPSLKKIIYVPGGLSNGHFEGKAYYRFGDVVSRQTTDYDGNAATEYWVCVRPAFGPEGKEESHWVCLNVLPKKNVYHYKGSNGTDYYLPTGLGTNKEQMQNLAEMLYAIYYPESWYQNVTQYAKDGLKMFHDFSVSNIKYHNQHFWTKVQREWTRKKICKDVFNASDDQMRESLRNDISMLYKGYSWWTKTSWDCTLYIAGYKHGQGKEQNLHKATYNSASHDMKNITFDCREMGSSWKNYSRFSNILHGLAWAVRHATGKELCANGRYDVKQPLNGCEEVYRYYSDVEPMNDLSEDPEETDDADLLKNAPTDGQGSYLPGDVVKDKDGNRWFCITGSPWSPLHSDITDRTAWFVTADFNNVYNTDIFKYLPREEALPELAERLMDCFAVYMTTVGQNPFKPGINGQLGDVMQHVKDYAGVDWLETLVVRDSTWTFNSRGKTYSSRSHSYMFNLAYMDSKNARISIARVILDHTQAGTSRVNCVVEKEDGSKVHYDNMFVRVNKYYHTYDPTKMRELTADEKYLGMNTWCLPWAVTSEKMRMVDLADQSKVDRYAKDDKWVTLPLFTIGATNTQRESPRTKVESTVHPEDYIGKSGLPRAQQTLGMYNEPILFLRVMKVEDKGGNKPNLKSTDGRDLSIVHMQDDASYYRSFVQNALWVTRYYSIKNDCFTIDNERYDLPAIPDLKGL